MASNLNAWRQVLAIGCWSWIIWDFKSRQWIVPDYNPRRSRQLFL